LRTKLLRHAIIGLVITCIVNLISAHYKSTSNLLAGEVTNQSAQRPGW